MSLTRLLETFGIEGTTNIMDLLNHKKIKTGGICLASLMAAYVFYKWREGPYYNKPYNLEGKVAIVTGCNTGIGKEMALDLARRGAKVYMACRNYEKCEQARSEIITETGNLNVFNRTLDLASLESIRQFVKDFLLEEPHLDILINNAGICCVKRSLTVDGFEQHLGVNHLGHFLLTNLLLDILKKSAPSRIIVVSSIIHYVASIKKKDLNSERHYNKMLAYAQSKLANILFTRKLSQLLKGSGVTVNCLHPGVVRTEIWRNDAILDLLNVLFSWLLLRSPKGGAQTALYLAIDPELKDKSGDYYDRMKKTEVAPKAKDDAMAEWLWQESEKLVGLNKEI
ncbi:retinol dehydrogenase 13-like [Lucilia sericata]|uniref:retinol dehydrogenase 13-like n=1 Tax=Lucilia sericata TaxID=13632 RepID=UPI0018A8092F|nr:retinol dehydrogenase 13-like [Lucilia sericata]